MELPIASLMMAAAGGAGGTGGAGGAGVRVGNPTLTPTMLHNILNHHGPIIPGTPGFNVVLPPGFIYILEDP